MKRDPLARPPDADLVKAVRNGDKHAFVEIVARHQAMVCGIALGILGDFTASEDAAQEAFLTAWRKFHDLREPERLRAWLAQIARNAALGHLRRERSHAGLEQAAAFADSSPAPDEAAASDEEAALVRDSLAKLPENYREPLILYYREGQSVRAVAEALGLSEDAVKQRLARGREMLRDRMSGLVETILTRTSPTAIFTMTIAVAIGALAAPPAVVAGVFGAASAAAATSAVSPTSFFAAMSTSKTFLIAAALVALAFIPVGYRVGAPADAQPPAPANAMAGTNTPPTAALPAPPPFEGSALFVEWRQLHETYGTNSQAMPALYKAIAALKDPFRRRAFRAALIAEWVQVDARGGLAFFLEKERARDTSQRRQFFDEWMAQNAPAAVDALTTSGEGWESLARDMLAEIARRLPSRVAEIAAQLPKPESYWDTKVRDAFAIVAGGNLAEARAAAEAMKGPNREQALAGVALAWAKNDLTGAASWVKSLPDSVDRDEIMRAALIGKASLDPAAALEQVGAVPPGGRQNYFATTTGARVLAEAAKTDFDGTVAWIAAHPGRLSHEDLMGLVNTVTARMNNDPAGFLTAQASAGSLKAIVPAIANALLNGAAGGRAAVWDWLKSQPESDSTRSLKQDVLNGAAWQDPGLAIRFAADIPRTPEGDALMNTLASSLFNGGSMLFRFDKIFDQAPDRMRQPLMDTAFNYLRSDTMDDPQRWIARLAQLPESSRAHGVEAIVRAWAGQMPEEAVGWINSLPPGEAHSSGIAAAAAAWAQKDVPAAAEWVASLPAGADRDRSAGALAVAMADKYPRQAWDWALSINDGDERDRAAAQVAGTVARRDPATARQWIDASPLAPELKARLQAGAAAPRTTTR